MQFGKNKHLKNNSPHEIILYFRKKVYSLNET